ncbi:DUF6879 family protein [Streptomyces sp. 7-21]|jgi:hypothetical protein|uniref:DUF6879 family protein n=1 Tax=Streptomyces sp. 7-21 TaxID=2802283 RepID=UPI00191FB620|nr:DUF6879 family protein [Streptomyces sp. 7-21]MBL1068240.1 hypothetical protein [Streptomyces sp. 7-21]
MTDVPPPPPLPEAEGERLPRLAYKADFRDHYRRAHGSSWKLERLQHFEETDNPSRDALRRGDWEEALRLIEARRERLRQRQAARERGHVFHRVRVVETPLTPYVQWELHSLRLQAEFGTKVRVVPAESLHGEETGGPLPELVLLGGETLYRVLYTAGGMPEGALRYTSAETVARWEAFLRGLYEAGEDVQAYFEREVAPLPPPRQLVRTE